MTMAAALLRASGAPFIDCGGLVIPLIEKHSIDDTGLLADCDEVVSALELFLTNAGHLLRYITWPKVLKVRAVDDDA